MRTSQRIYPITSFLSQKRVRERERENERGRGRRRRRRE
jgi:hypothetical protein